MLVDLGFLFWCIDFFDVDLLFCFVVIMFFCRGCYWENLYIVDLICCCCVLINFDVEWRGGKGIKRVCVVRMRGWIDLYVLGLVFGVGWSVLGISCMCICNCIVEYKNNK